MRVGDGDAKVVSAAHDGKVVEFDVYCDESRQELFWTKEKPQGRSYVLIGGIWLPTDYRKEMKEQIKALRLRHSLPGEFKWTKVSPSRLAFYKDLVDLFFNSQARFRCILLPTDQIDCVQFHAGDSELMFYKFYYQLIRHWVHDCNEYNVFLDLKTNRTSERLPTLRKVLQNSNYLASIKNLQALPSKQLDLIQLADFLLGAVGYKFHRSTGSESKTAIVKAIEGHLKHEIEPTYRAERKFNVFRWRPSGQW